MGQTDAGAFVSFPLVQSLEDDEYFFLMLWRNANAIVGDGKLAMAILSPAYRCLESSTRQEALLATLCDLSAGAV